jgi:hypothetical protein
MQSCQIGYISRKVNSALHDLAKAVIIDQVWIEDISNCIRDIVLLE